MDYCTACSSEVELVFYSNLIQNCKWNKLNFSSASTNSPITPPPSPHLLVFSHGSVPSLTRSAAAAQVTPQFVVSDTEPDPLVLYALTAAVEGVCLLPEAILFPSLLPVSVSHAGFLRFALVKCRSRCGDSKTDKWNQQNAKQVRRKSDTCVSELDYIYLLWHTWPPAEFKIRPMILFVIICFYFASAHGLSVYCNCMKTVVETFSNIKYSFLLRDNGLSSQGCLFLLSFLVLDVPAVA